MIGKKSLQEIEDFYVGKGIRGEMLRKELKKDREYQRLLKEKKEKITKKFKVSFSEKKKYVLSTNTDFELLNKCKVLSNKRLSKQDKEIVKLIKAQLEDDWRKPLVVYLNKLIRKYKK